MSEEEKESEEEIPPEPPQWEYKKEFEINKRMKDIVKLSISATEAELAMLRRKLDKLTYGS